MPDKRQKFGAKNESLAAWYLKKNGYKIIEQNYRTPLGEIDIIAREKKPLFLWRSSLADRFAMETRNGL